MFDLISLVVIAGVLVVVSVGLFAGRGAGASEVTVAGLPGPHASREPQPGFRIMVPTPDPDAVLLARARLAPDVVARRDDPERSVTDGGR